MTSRRGKDGRKNQPWFRLDAGFIYDDKIVVLGADHGGVGPFVYIAVLAAAKTQDDKGTVKLGWRQIAHHCFLGGGEDEARAIIATAERIGLLKDVKGDDLGFTALVAGWEDFQRPMPRTEAERAADYRARHPSRSVTPDRDADTPRRDATATKTETTTETEASGHPQKPVVVRDAGSSSGAIPACFEEVWQILEAARPALMLTDASVMSALNAYPESVGHDHLRAAHCAAATANGPNRRVDVGHVLLLAELRKQTSSRNGGSGRRPDPTRGGARSAVDSDIERYMALADKMEREGAA